MLNTYNKWLALNGEDIVWKQPGRGVRIGKPVGLSLGKNGYYTFCFKRKNHYYHRVKFYLAYGYMPDYIDHVDGNPLNNILSNIREATNQQNMRNSAKKSSAKSLYKGVSPKRTKWRAYIAVDKKQIHLGVFDTEIEAACAYNEKAVVLFGIFAKLNNV